MMLNKIKITKPLMSVILTTFLLVIAMPMLSGCSSKSAKYIKTDLNVNEDAPKTGWGCKFTRLNRFRCMTRFD